MRPAWSIIFFTSSSGLGLGLAAWIVLGLVPLESATHLLAIAGFTFGLIGAGLFSSTLHLGHPERAWRALSQWRSSWLSREGVLAVAVMAALFIWFVYVHGGATTMIRSAAPSVTAGGNSTSRTSRSDCSAAWESSPRSCRVARSEPAWRWRR